MGHSKPTDLQHRRFDEWIRRNAAVGSKFVLLNRSIADIVPIGVYHCLSHKLTAIYRSCHPHSGVCVRFMAFSRVHSLRAVHVVNEERLSVIYSSEN